jgi:hypothetical protein
MFRYGFVFLSWFTFLGANIFTITDKHGKVIHSQNIQSIYESLNKALYYIERNANAKLIFLDLSINLTKFIHTSEKSHKL